MTQRRLGRGLEALLGRAPEAAGGEEAVDVAPPIPAGIMTARVDQLERNPYQPRQHFDDEELDALAQNIQAHGMLHPIVVRLFDGRYQVVAGERRWRAAQKAGWQEVPVQVKEVDDRQLAELAIVENLQRKDLGPLEKAASFQRYLDQHGGTQEELAARLNVTRSTVTNFIRLLELPEPVQKMLQTGDLTAGHARALLPLGEEHEQISFAKRVKNEQMSVRAVESAVQDLIRQSDTDPLAQDDTTFDLGPAPANRAREDNLASLEQNLRTALGTKVEIKQTGKDKGRIVIHFTSSEEFERLQQHLCHHQQQPQVVEGEWNEQPEQQHEQHEHHQGEQQHHEQQHEQQWDQQAA